jgi:hypothetical protein
MSPSFLRARASLMFESSDHMNRKIMSSSTFQQPRIESIDSKLSKIAPFLDLSLELNPVSWYAMYAVFRSYGALWKARISIYALVGLVIAILILLKGIFDFSVGNLGGGFIDISLTVNSCYMIYCICQSIIYGARTNILVYSHVKLLTRAQLELREQISSTLLSKTALHLQGRSGHNDGTSLTKGQEQQLRKQQATENLLEIVLNSLKSSVEQEPVRVLYMTATYTLVGNLTAAFLSGVVSLVVLYQRLR